MDRSPLTRCPEAADLRRLLEGNISTADAEAIEKHVDACDTCADLIAEMAPDSGLLTMMSGKSDRNGKQPERPGGSGTGAGHGADELDPPSSPDELGTLGPYRIVRELGHGGMGVVYAAQDTRLRRLVALKLMRAGASKDAQYQARFEREVDALARLSHPNIVQVYEASRHRGSPYLAMEFVPDGSLGAILRGHPQTPAVAASLTATLADAVHFAHRQGVVHRDLKPANILLLNPGATAESGHLTADVTPKIADFGLARHTDQEAMTQTGDMLGTPSYMAPEMMRGGDHGAKDSPAVDVYGLGAILYELLTGRPPFRGESMPDTFEQVRHLDPVPIRRLQPRVPRDLETICLKCLQKEPRKRYATASSLAEDLRNFLAGRPIVARPAGPIERFSKWSRRKPAWAAAIGIVLVAALALIAVGIRYEGRLRQSVVAANKSAEEADRQRAKAQDNLDEAERQREKAQTAYREARATMDKMIAHASDPKRGDLPRVRELRNDQLEEALAFYLRVGSQDADASAEVKFDVADSLLQASLLQLQLGREGPTENLRRAAELLQTLIAENPTDRRYRHAYAECLTQQGFCAVHEEKLKFMLPALKEIEALHAAQPENLQYRHDLARLCHALGQVSQHDKKLNEAEGYYERAIQLRKLTLADNPGWHELRLAMNQTRVNLLLLQQARGRSIIEIEPEYKQVAADLEAISRADPSSPAASIALAGLRNNWSHMPLDLIRQAIAVKDLGKSIDDLEAFLQREPNWSEARHALYGAHGARARLYDRLRRYPEAAADYQRVVDLAPTPSMRKANRVDLGYLLILAKNFSAAITAVEQTAADPAPMTSAYSLARHLQTCATLAAFAEGDARPFEPRALAAAMSALQRTRKELPAAQWSNWMKVIQGFSDLVMFLKRPELEEQVR